MTNDNLYFVIYFNVIFIPFFFLLGRGVGGRGLRVKLNEDIVNFFYLKN